MDVLNIIVPSYSKSVTQELENTSVYFNNVLRRAIDIINCEVIDTVFDANSCLLYILFGILVELIVFNTFINNYRHRSVAKNERNKYPRNG